MDIFDLLGKKHYELVADNPTYRQAFNPQAGDWTEEDEQKFLDFIKTLNQE